MIDTRFGDWREEKGLAKVRKEWKYRSIKF